MIKITRLILTTIASLLFISQSFAAFPGSSNSSFSNEDGISFSTQEHGNSSENIETTEVEESQGEEAEHSGHESEGISTLDLLALMVLLAALFMFINIHYIKLPGTIGLMIQALVLSLVIVAIGFFVPAVREGAENIMREVDFTKVLLNIMLSFLLYAGALHVDIDKLKEEAASVAVLAIVGTLMSTFLIGTAIYYFLGVFELGFDVSFIYCLLFGALISPTDPIAVLAILKTTNISKNLQIKIEGESLFNDGIGVVVFLTILAIATGGGHGGGDITPSSVAIMFGQEVIGGIALGFAFGALGYWLLVIIDNAHEELEVLTTLSLVLVGTQLAVFLHISAPLAMVVMGLIVGRGNSTAGELDENGEEIEGIAGEYVMKFWHLVDEAMNAILFILIGLEMIVIIEESSAVFLQIGIIGIFIILAGRFIGVAIPVTILDMFKKSAKGTIPILTWGGLRGGISIALALSLQAKGEHGVGTEVKYLIVTMTYCVVVFSILVQGMTIEKLVKKYL